MTELKYIFWLLEDIFPDNFFGRTLNCHKTLAVRAFDLIPTLRTRPECQLSADIHSHKAGTKLPHESATGVHLCSCGSPNLSSSTRHSDHNYWFFTNCQTRNSLLLLTEAFWPISNQTKQTSLRILKDKPKFSAITFQINFINIKTIEIFQPKP